MNGHAIRGDEEVLREVYHYPSHEDDGVGMDQRRRVKGRPAANWVEKPAMMTIVIAMAAPKKNRSLPRRCGTVASITLAIAFPLQSSAV
jgi:hypothetical protein